MLNLFPLQPNKLGWTSIIRQRNANVDSHNDMKSIFSNRNTPKDTMRDYEDRAV